MPWKLYPRPRRLGRLLVLVSLTGCVSTNIPVTYPPNAPRISSEFNSTEGVNGGNRHTLHNGIDIIGYIGQPILSAAAGTVLEASVEKCWGPTIAIDHGRDADGKKVVALYGHVDTMLVKKGDSVKRGQVIAHLGEVKYECMAGVRHLHFQIGREYRTESEKGNTYWGHSYFLKDGSVGVNPHLYWADGPGMVTCYHPGKNYPPATLTYPVLCT